ncbi:VWA domain-containing protein [Pseudomonas putida]|uniref:VWA domain-containing protein n=1 Tax=Pseudomonas putida TaxID=303 RepID=UPI00215F204A|nr:VWA domain-containing protein [Pseudomonas putida]UVL78730.1 VWA domain-containing protein [Pseudomonas putida]
MQRVTRDTSPAKDDLRVLEQAMAIIVRHFPPSIAHLFATPRNGKDGLREWWSELQGQPHRYHDLGAEQQAALLRLYDERQEAVHQLVSKLESLGQANDAALLRKLIGPADLNNLYSINGQPLVVRWAEPAPVKPLPASVPPRPVPVVRRRWVWLPWFLLPLLGLLLLALALWFGWPYLQHWLGNRPATPFACVKDTRIQPPEFSVVLDTSGSMQLNVATTLEDEQWFFQHINDDPNIDQQRVAQLTQAPVRMDVAKSSLTHLINDLHPAVDMRVVTFDGCRAPLDHGVFTLAQRPALIKGIQALVPNDGTALAASLDVAARTMNGRDRDGVILMFIDGADGCEQDVCAVAQRIAREQPRLRVNLVDISNSNLASCVAESTGGSIYSASDAGQVAAAIKLASQEVSSTADCN